MPDYYQALGVPKTATAEEIKKAYRKAALRTHPDRATIDQKKNAEDAFRVVHAAYEILSNEGNRQLYDKHGVWPPPSPSKSSSKSAQPTRSYKQAPPEGYRPFVPPVYESDAPPPGSAGVGGAQYFTFSDPYTLFNMMFAEWSQQQPHFGFPGRPPTRGPAPYFDQPQFIPPFPPHFASFTQAAAQFAGPPPPQPPMPQPQHRHTSKRMDPTASAASTPPHTDDEVNNNGWIKESTVTKMTPQGTRETTIKKTAPDGTIYITRIGGDGSARHSIYRDGQEHQTSKPAPERIPLSQTQAREPPVPTPPRSQPRHAATAPTEPTSHSSRHAASASQPINLADAPPHHRRSASRAETRPNYNTYRVASPAPLENPGNVNVNPKYPSPYAQAPTQRRVASPSPDRGMRREREKEKDLRRNHTLPATVSAAAAAPMPRPQSPHFYRPRTNSEHKRQLERAQSQAQQQGGRPREREQQAPPRVPDEGPAYVFSDNEGGRSRPAAYRPSRSNQTYPREAPYPTMPPQVPTKDHEVPRSSAQQEFPRSSTQQEIPRSATQQEFPRRQEIPRSSTVRPYHEDPRSSARNSQEPEPIVIAPPPVMTNELGLGGLDHHIPTSLRPERERSSRHDAREPRTSRHDDRENVHQNQPLGSRSRNESFEEIVFAGQGQAQPRPQGHGGYAHPQQMYADPGIVYGNPMPHPPGMREPWSAEPHRRSRQAAV